MVTPLVAMSRTLKAGNAKACADARAGTNSHASQARASEEKARIAILQVSSKAARCGRQEVCETALLSTSPYQSQSPSTAGLRSARGTRPASGVVRADGGARQLLRCCTHPRPDARRRQQERCTSR